MICDGANQKEISQRLGFIAALYNDRFYVSQEFCKTFVNKTMAANYFKVTTLANISESLSEMINCKTGDKPITYDVS